MGSPTSRKRHHDILNVEAILYLTLLSELEKHWSDG